MTRWTGRAICTFASCALACTACEPRDEPEAAAPADSPATATADTATTTTPALASGAMLDPDSATREQLLMVPGIDAAAADALIAARPFDNMLAVDRVLAGSLSDSQRVGVYQLLWKPLDLNTASGDEILLIPGVGPRMRHEFEEYRPYTDIAQFRREIGKYVDDTTVVRYEKYVTIRQ